ncbi:MAG: FmdB family transcriptional regulator [Acidimicrobiales bacterium]|jgi:putative FmdB family regulatory protein|nr:FmdB family transcriptional regulator [Acidimicrobiales bacterium]
MPTYEYRCRDCGHEFEAQQAFSDDPLTECPACTGSIRKVFGAVGISFKGSGFYKTDSRSSGSKSSSSSSAASSATTSGDSASSGSSTPSESSSSSSGSDASTTAKPAATATAG